MDDFDDEPGTGGSYEDAFALPLYNPDTIPRRIVVRQRNGFERVSISWKRFERELPEG